jgi:hypothetical protein
MPENPEDRQLTPDQLRRKQSDAMESLFDTVWQCEREWALDDRIDLALKISRKRP